MRPILFFMRYEVWGTIRRALYGWAPMDTWSFDRYLANVSAPALRHIAQSAHGYPRWVLDEYPELTNFDGTVSDEAAMEVWRNWLIEKATWFEWYTNDELGLHPDMDDDQKLTCIEFFEKQHRYFKEVVLADFCLHFDSIRD